jgi:hypothetical protein
MKSALSTILTLVFLLPAFGPWMPHSALQALHVQQEKHHGSGDHDHHGHDHDAQNSVSHSVHFDVVTYFSDYLHVELQNTDHADLKKPALDTQKIDFMQSAVLMPPAYAPSSYIQITGPPPDNWRLSHFDLPIYLATQRLRI